MLGTYRNKSLTQFHGTFFWTNHNTILSSRQQKRRRILQIRDTRMDAPAALDSYVLSCRYSPFASHEYSLKHLTSFLVGCCRFMTITGADSGSAMQFLEVCANNSRFRLVDLAVVTSICRLQRSCDSSRTGIWTRPCVACSSLDCSPCWWYCHCRDPPSCSLWCLQVNLYMESGSQSDRTAFAAPRLHATSSNATFDSSIAPSADMDAATAAAIAAAYGNECAVMLAQSACIFSFHLLY